MNSVNFLPDVYVYCDTSILYFRLKQFTNFQTLINLEIQQLYHPVKCDVVQLKTYDNNLSALNSLNQKELFLLKFD